LTLPTGNAKAYVGARTVTAQLGLAVARDLGPVGLLANLGIRTGEGTSVGSLSLGPAFTWRAGAAWGVTDAATVGVEADGDKPLGNGAHRGSAPAEVLASGRYRVWRDLVVLAGAGAGISQGVGAPEWRVLAGVTWSPRAERPVPPSADAPPPSEP